MKFARKTDIRWLWGLPTNGNFVTVHAPTDSHSSCNAFTRENINNVMVNGMANVGNERGTNYRIHVSCVYLSLLAKTATTHKIS